VLPKSLPVRVLDKCSALTSAGRFGLINLPNSNTDMKRVVLPSHRLLHLAGRLLLGSCLIIGCSGSAQNLLTNGDFELPLGTTNWTIHYVHGGSQDYAIKDRTIAAARDRSQLINTRGLHFRPSMEKLAHAYASQTISGLEADHSYTIKGYIWGESSTWNQAPTTYRVYFEAIGALGTVKSPEVSVAPGSSYTLYTITQKPDANGKIEVRLHHDKFDWCNYDKLVECNGYFDDFSVTY
jgi:hypothetical protein